MQCNISRTISKKKNPMIKNGFTGNPLYTSKRNFVLRNYPFKSGEQAVNRKIFIITSSLKNIKKKTIYISFCCIFYFI